MDKTYLITGIAANIGIIYTLYKINKNKVTIKETEMQTFSEHCDKDVQTDCNEKITEDAIEERLRRISDLSEEDLEEDKSWKNFLSLKIK